MIENANKYLPTTIDNPYNPFTNWDQWFAFDFSKGYLTCQILDKFYKTSSLIEGTALDEFMYALALEKIMDLYPYYVIVTKESEIKPVNIDLMELFLGIDRPNTTDNGSKDMGEGSKISTPL